MKRMSVLVWALGIVLAAAGPVAFGDGSRALVVDDDKLGCPNAEFTSIQAAVDAAEPVPPSMSAPASITSGSRSRRIVSGCWSRERAAEPWWTAT
jgi:hypothetical protein